MTQITETGLTLLNKEKPTLTQLVLINMPPGSSIEDAGRLALKEIMNFELVLTQRPELKACTPNSVLLAVKQVISDNLTLAPSAALVYLYPGKVLVGNNEANQKVYETVLTYDPTANGRLSIARQAGRILDNKRPVVTYDATGKVETVTVEFLVPSYPAPRWESIKFGQSHFAKWQQKSAAKFGGTASANYFSWNKGIDPDFASTKAIRHGLNKLGTNMNERPNMAVQMDFKGMPPEVVNKESQENVLQAPAYTSYEEVQNNSAESFNIDVKPEDL